MALTKPRGNLEPNHSHGIRWTYCHRIPHNPDACRSLFLHVFTHSNAEFDGYSWWVSHDSWCTFQVGGQNLPISSSVVQLRSSSEPRLDIDLRRWQIQPEISSHLASTQVMFQNFSLYTQKIYVRSFLPVDRCINQMQQKQINERLNSIWTIIWLHDEMHLQSLNSERMNPWIKDAPTSPPTTRPQKQLGKKHPYMSELLFKKRNHPNNLKLPLFPTNTSHKS